MFRLPHSAFKTFSPCESCACFLSSSTELILCRAAPRVSTPRGETIKKGGIGMNCYSEWHACVRPVFILSSRPTSILHAWWPLSMIPRRKKSYDRKKIYCSERERASGIDYEDANITHVVFI